MHDLRRLRAFHEVAERGSFSAAALELGYAQSVVSHHIAALEQELGLTLVDRSTRPVRLTSAGERLRAHAVEILGRVARAEDELRAIAGLEAGSVRVGAFLTACTTFLPPALARFAAQRPNVEVQVEQVEPVDALRRLRAGDLDLAAVFTNEPAQAPPGAEDGLSFSHLGEDPYRLVLPAAHRLASKRRIALADLARERFAAPPRSGGGTAYYGMLDRLAALGGFEPDIAYEVSDLTVARALVSAGLAIGVMPEITIPVPRPDVAVRPLPQGLKEHRSVFAVWLEGRRVPAVAPLVRLLEEGSRSHLAAPG